MSGNAEQSTEAPIQQTKKKRKKFRKPTGPDDWFGRPWDCKAQLGTYEEAAALREELVAKGYIPNASDKEGTPRVKIRRMASTDQFKVLTRG